MTRASLISTIKEKKSFLCIGLDTDAEKLPAQFSKDYKGVIEFNKAIIDATKAYCVSYKINTAFYEALGSKGWEAMEETVAYIPDTHFKIADAKRADIGNTSSQYAKAFFETMDFDAVTVAPYMGEDSIRPFLNYKDKWTIVLGLTSNKGAADFEMLPVATDGADDSTCLYQKVISTVCKWGNTENLMFVVGATQAAQIKNIRTIVPEHFLLVPGIGFQGGNLQDICNNGLNNDCGLLVNVSRAILFAGSNTDFANEAARVAKEYQYEMAAFIK